MDERWGCGFPPSKAGCRKPGGLLVPSRSWLWGRGVFGELQPHRGGHDSSRAPQSPGQTYVLSSSW